jgi:hypothetical protein
LAIDDRFISAEHEIYFLKNQLFTSLLKDKHPPPQITFTLYNKLADNKNSPPFIEVFGLMKGTDTIIYNLKGHKTVRKNLESHINDPMCISIITLRILKNSFCDPNRLNGLFFRAD